MSKRIIAVFMLAGMMFSLAACNGTGLIPGMETTSGTTTITLPETSATSESQQETTTETTSEETTSQETTTEETTTEETTSETTSETTTETTKAATPTPKPIGKTTVSNAYKRTFSVTGYGKFTTKYPKVTIDGVSTSAINKEIAKKFSPIAKKNDSVVTYSYYIGKKYVSILVSVQLDAGMDGSDRFVYNISRETGKKLTKAQMLKLIGVSSSTFNSKVKSSVKKYWADDILKHDKSAKTKKMYNTAIGSKSINSAVPFMNSKGKKCYLIRQMKTPGQSLYMDFASTY